MVHGATIIAIFHRGAFQRSREKCSKEAVGFVARENTAVTPRRRETSHGFNCPDGFQQEIGFPSFHDYRIRPISPRSIFSLLLLVLIRCQRTRFRRARGNNEKIVKKIRPDCRVRLLRGLRELAKEKISKVHKWRTTLKMIERNYVDKRFVNGVPELFAACK